MNKKVLVISSSPRRNGNSDILCEQFIREAEEAGNLAEKVFLKDKKLNYSKGYRSYSFFPVTFVYGFPEGE
jgi:multimeric flavodoxin WrbA